MLIQDERLAPDKSGRVDDNLDQSEQISTDGLGKVMNQRDMWSWTRAHYPEIENDRPVTVRLDDRLN